MQNKSAQHRATVIGLILGTLPTCTALQGAEDRARTPVSQANYDRYLNPKTIEQRDTSGPELRSGEYIVPDAVMKAYVAAVSRALPFLSSTTAGGYITRDRLDSPKKQAAFRSELAESGYDLSAIGAFEDLLRQGDSIIMPEQSVQNGFIQSALPHERLHKAMKRLSPENYALMRETALRIREMTNEDGGFLVQERFANGGFIQASVLSGSFEEFYAYLADGKLNDAAEAKLLELSPKAHALFTELRDATR